ncbi:MAG: LytTR family DNA-binding domain-containing protein [Bacteroidota bacterium]
MINCIIVDDEPLARELLESYVSELEGLELVASCKDAHEAGDILKKTAVDLILLDINMPKTSGVSFYKTLVKRPKVIFTTAYADYAVEGFELDAVDYLLKPFSFERFKKAIQKVKPTEDEVTADFIMLKADKRNHKVNFRQISHFESIGDYVKVFLKEGEVLIISKTLKKLETLLPKTSFMRVHKSFIISIDKIKFLEGNQIQLPMCKIPIGQSYREEVKSKLV